MPQKTSVAHDLTKKQREELQELIKDARKKEENDQSGNFMYRLRGPPWRWFIKKISKKAEITSDGNMEEQKKNKK